jgi:hypothetical protein
VSNNASIYRELPFCPAARARSALPIPDNAGTYRGIRATVEQPAADIGLDHHGRGRLDDQRARSSVIDGIGIGTWRGIKRQQ